MVENISGVNSSKTNRTDNASSNAKRSVEDASAGKALETGRTRDSVDVELSEAVKRAEEKASYDEVRVRELKTAIESGNYPLDREKIAEKFADLESLL